MRLGDLGDAEWSRRLAMRTGSWSSMKEVTRGFEILAQLIARCTYPTSPRRTAITERPESVPEQYPPGSYVIGPPLSGSGGGGGGGGYGGAYSPGIGGGGGGGISVTPEPEPDVVNHPPHYNSHPSGIECIDIVRHHNFDVGNAIKYLWRCGLKIGENDLTALKKAEFYIKDEIARLEGEE